MVLQLIRWVALVLVFLAGPVATAFLNPGIYGGILFGMLSGFAAVTLWSLTED